MESPLVQEIIHPRFDVHTKSGSIASCKINLIFYVQSRAVLFFFIFFQIRVEGHPTFIWPSQASTRPPDWSEAAAAAAAAVVTYPPMRHEGEHQQALESNSIEQAKLDFWATTTTNNTWKDKESQKRELDLLTYVVQLLLPDGGRGRLLFFVFLFPRANSFV